MNPSLSIILFLMLCISCSGIENEKSVSEKSNNVELIYAEKFELGSSGEIIVIEPWPGAVNSRTYISEKTPKRVVVTSTTHLPFLELLGVEDRLVGFPNTKYISSEKINLLVKSGQIIDLGPDGNINMELLIASNPDLVIAFDMGNESTFLDKIEESGIPVIYNADFLETTALGRAEWIKFFGAIFDRQLKADSIFDEISYTYQSLKKLAATKKTKPSVFSGVLYGDAWYMPGGNNWSAQFFKDAGGEYLWRNDSSSGWLEISFESVFEKARKADYWVGISTFSTLEELANQDNRYAEFEAFKRGSVYNYSKRLGPGGGFDFFESGYSRPDIILGDMIKIFSPELLPDYETFYFKKIE